MVWSVEEKKKWETHTNQLGCIYTYTTAVSNTLKRHQSSHRLCLETILRLPIFGTYASTRTPGEWSNPLSAGQKSKTPPCGFGCCIVSTTSGLCLWGRFPPELGSTDDERVAMIIVIDNLNPCVTTSHTISISDILFQQFKPDQHLLGGIPWTLWPTLKFWVLTHLQKAWLCRQSVNVLVSLVHINFNILNKWFAPSIKMMPHKAFLWLDILLSWMLPTIVDWYFTHLGKWNLCQAEQGFKRILAYRLLSIKNLYCVYLNADALRLEFYLGCIVFRVQLSSINFVVADWFSCIQRRKERIGVNWLCS